jgi:hypothetical protein
MGKAASGQSIAGVENTRAFSRNRTPQASKASTVISRRSVWPRPPAALAVRLQHEEEQAVITGTAKPARRPPLGFKLIDQLVRRASRRDH